ARSGGPTLLDDPERDLGLVAAVELEVVVAELELPGDRADRREPGGLGDRGVGREFGQRRERGERGHDLDTVQRRRGADKRIFANRVAAPGTLTRCRRLRLLLPYSRSRWSAAVVIRPSPRRPAATSHHRPRTMIQVRRPTLRRAAAAGSGP